MEMKEQEQASLALRVLKQAMVRNAKMVAAWQAWGFVRHLSVLFQRMGS